VGSLIARTTGMGVYLNAGRENAVASTKAFTSQVTVLSLVGKLPRERDAEDGGGSGGGSGGGGSSMLVCCHVIHFRSSTLLYCILYYTITD
jgi:hypothetical protein